MWRSQCVLVLVVQYVGVALSWDIAVTKGTDELEFYENDTMTESFSFEDQNLTALVYDEINDRIVYVDKQTGGDRICSYSKSSNDNACHTQENGRTIHGLAFDPATELLFFTDTNERSINWISFKKGSNNNIYGNLLIKTGDATPTDVAVDSCGGHVYWINTNLTVPTIERAAFNGDGREEILTFSGIAPHSLVINQLTKKMYVIHPQDSLVDHIWYSDLNGDNPTFLEYLSSNDTDTNIVEPPTTSLFVSKTFLYWVDWCPDCNMLAWKLPFTSSNSTTSYDSFSLDTSATGGVAVNYKIKENYQYIQDCEPLNNLDQNNSEEPVCVNGQSVCKCTPGYIGERCNVRA